MNGSLDIALGNYIGGFTVAGRELPAAAGNQIVYTDKDGDDDRKSDSLRFSAHDLNALENGQTLSVLFSDFNNDGRTDLLVANDFGIDESFIGTADGFRRVDKQDGLFEQSPWTTMSIETADTNNDLLLDTFSVGFGGKNVKHKGINVSTAVDYTEAQKQFEREVHEVFQRHGTFMLQTVRWKNTVKGATTTFQKVGKGVATTKARHGQITPMNQSHTAIECTLSDFYAGDWVDQLDETKVQHDERAVIARGGAAALGRKVDEQIIAVADTSSNDIGGDATLTRAILLQAYETLIGNDVPNDGQLFGFLTPRSWSIAMTISDFANGDFIGQQSLPFLVGANPRTWMGVH